MMAVFLVCWFAGLLMSVSSGIIDVRKITSGEAAVLSMVPGSISTRVQSYRAPANSALNQFWLEESGRDRWRAASAWTAQEVKRRSKTHREQSIYRRLTDRWSRPVKTEGRS